MLYIMLRNRNRHDEQFNRNAFIAKHTNHTVSETAKDFGDLRSTSLRQKQKYAGSRYQSEAKDWK